MSPPETPPPPEQKDAPPTAPAPAPADPAVAAVEQAERSARVAEKSAAGQPDPAEAEAVLAQLGLEVKIAPQEGQAPITVEKIGEALTKAKPEQLITLNAILNDEIAGQEQEDLQKKFNVNGLLDWAGVVKALGEGKLSVRELVVVSVLLETNPAAITTQGVDKASVEQASQRIKTLKQALEKQLNPQYTADQVDALFKKEEYQAAYATFIKDQDQAKFLAAIPNEDNRKIIEWAITAPPTIAEKQTVAVKFKDLIAKKDAAAIAEAVGKGEMNYREGMVAKTLLDDLQRIAESQDKIPDELKGLGFMGLLEKLIEKLTKLMEKLTGQLDKAFAKKSDQFDTSPVGGDQKFTIEKASAGINLLTEKAGADVKPVTGGTVDSVEGDKVVILAGKGKVVYQGLIPAVKKGDTVEAGKTVLGKMKDTVLNFQMINEDGKQIPETRVAELLGKYAQKPPEAKAEAPALNITQSPIALTGDAKLNVTKNFSQTGSNGLEITAPKDTGVVMMADGIITKSENGTIEVGYKDGKTIKFTGLKNDASLHKADTNVVVKAGEAIGAVGDTGILGIQVLENDGKQIDPATLLANYLPPAPTVKPAPPSPTPPMPTAPPAAVEHIKKA